MMPFVQVDTIDGAIVATIRVLAAGANVLLVGRTSWPLRDVKARVVLAFSGGLPSSVMACGSHVFAGDGLSPDSVIVTHAMRNASLRERIRGYSRPFVAVLLNASALDLALDLHLREPIGPCLNALELEHRSWQTITVASALRAELDLFLPRRNDFLFLPLPPKDQTPHAAPDLRPPSPHPDSLPPLRASEVGERGVGERARGDGLDEAEGHELGVARPGRRPDAGAGMAGGAAEEGPRFYVKRGTKIKSGVAAQLIANAAAECVRWMNLVGGAGAIRIVADPTMPPGKIVFRNDALPVAFLPPSTPGFDAWLPDGCTPESIEDAARRFGRVKPPLVMFEVGSEASVEAAMLRAASLRWKRGSTFDRVDLAWPLWRRFVAEVGARIPVDEDVSHVDYAIGGMLAVRVQPLARPDGAR